MFRINVKKYVLICCFAFSLSNVNCDVLLLDVPDDDILLNDAGCTASCMMQNTTAILSNCYEDCENTNGSVVMRDIVSNETIQLICRESDLLVLKVISHRTSNEHPTNIQRPSDGGQLFLFKLQENNSASPHQIICIANSSIVEIDGLQKNTSYDVTATIFTGSLELYSLQKAIFKTLETDNNTPQTISSDSIELSYSKMENSSTMITTISWEPTPDMSCNYYFLLYPTQDEDYSTPFEQHFRKLEPFELYHLTIETLQYETRYVLDVHGINAKNAYIEGNRSSIAFTTPTCWQILGYDSKKCRPLPLKNIQSTFKMISTDVYEINVTWDLPEIIPDFYDVTLNLYSGRGNFVAQNVSGFKNIAYFPQVNTTELKYDVQIVSFSKAGITTNPIIDFSFKTIPIYNIHQANAWIVVTIIILLVSSLSIIFVNVAMGVRRNRLNSAKDFFNDIHLRGMIRSHNRDGMEIDPSNVDLHELLGEGAFGMVRRGTLKPRNWEIAVKMLKENATTDDKKCFLTEITIMKSVGQHENILGIVGHSIKLDNKLMLLTEYCSEGNLLDYLRKFREIFSKRQISSGNHVETENSVWNELYEMHHSNIVINQNNCHLKCEDGDRSVLFVENRCYEMLPSSTNIELANKHNQNSELNKINPQTNQMLTSKDLLNFAKQIATGMEFLASNKIVHRDLAARNVLVCSDKTVKIADFGLSRDIYVDNIYFKSSAGRLPIKWLALESMTEHTYTSQSDVWSFGILLYEIVTLGCTPYPTVPVDCLVEYLKSGNRMPKPPNCSFELYDLMSCCWHQEPEKRPLFADLACKVNSFIRSSEANEILHIENECSCKTIEVQDLSDTSYMTPL